MLKNRRVVLGVTGGIAAYKAVEILRELKKKDADVAVVMTESAKKFVSPLTFQTLSGNPVSHDLFTLGAQSEMEHLSLAERADLLLIAPATANTLAKMAAGIADDLLSTLFLATVAPVLAAPAMNTRMIENPATRANMTTLASRGIQFVEPESGPLAAEEAGYGRLAAVSTIVSRVEAILAGRGDLTGRHFLITAGPTREALDPVRFLSNRSSGKMGAALAARAMARGATVSLIAGPLQVPPPAGAEIVAVMSAEQMRSAVMERLDSSDVLIMSAAVSDFRPRSVERAKMKKKGRQSLVIELEATPDILSEAGAKKGKSLLVGFAAETENTAEGAREKLDRKNLDMVVANDVTLPGAGFDTDTNEVDIFTRSGRHIPLAMASKAEIADGILDQVVLLLDGEK